VQGRGFPQPVGVFSRLIQEFFKSPVAHSTRKAGEPAGGCGQRPHSENSPSEREDRRW